MRISGLRELGAAFKSVNDALHSEQPPLIEIQMSARQIRNAARDQYRWFPADSGPQPDVKTSAKPEIWSDPAKFKAAQDAFAARADAFQKAVTSGNMTEIRAETRNLGQSCKSCHDSFRIPRT